MAVGYGRQTLLGEIDLDVPEGAMVVITGPSGIGKSSLLYCLAGLLRPKDGSVTICGQDLWSLRDGRRAHLRARSMGFLFQDYVLDPSRSVRDNVLEPLAYAGERVRAHHRARAVELVERVGVEVPLERRPGQISGGQAQRIALARALVVGPSILFADEPTGSLDAQSGEVVLGVVRSELADRSSPLEAAVIVTHDPTVAARADLHLRLERAGSGPALVVSP